MSNRPSTLQLETLVEFLEQNPGIARGFLRTSLGKQESKQKWAEIAVTLNALGGVIKDGPGWSKYWAEKKCSLKKLCSQYAASIRRTGGGEGERCSLSQLDKRLVAVMGGTSFASGDSELAVNPFPQMHSSVVESESTSTILEFSEMDVEIISVPPPNLATSGTSRAETAAAPDAVPPQTSTNTNTSRRRSRRLLSRTIDTEMDRMARIEERRVEAERLSAEALSDTSRRLERLADAAEQIAVAITGVANALQQIANNLGRT
ncbi:unnamed protein product [Spodoptera littoralis]|uniref:Regulatory protein zeste n=3 Tax=Spodoptera littoralis TaxID=7109 RepID=A0A9P0MY82_SPOLI|nr:unnamed protein product [Spodoptera littoralis]CAB3510983.1 unnamed protein product [Spodoptera littoralis]CAH1634788.1 unnamed protein product [Spodoptera littoralis]CAH1640624.1 unnamed protein product [Spodoptera littoralis]